MKPLDRTKRPPNAGFSFSMPASPEALAEDWKRYEKHAAPAVDDAIARVLAMLQKEHDRLRDLTLDSYPEDAVRKVADLIEREWGQS